CHRGSGFCPFLRDGLGRLLLRGRLALLRAGNGAWRLPVALCLCLVILARGVAHIPLWWRWRGGLSRRLGALMWPSYGAGITIVIACQCAREWHTREYPSPSYRDCQSA